MVKNFFSILSARQSNILSGASILMATMFASRFLGLIRDRLVLHYFTSTEAGIFFTASKLPEALFTFLVFGTLSVAFIPVFIEHLHHKGEEDAFKFASNILNLSLVVFGLVAIVAFIFISPLNSLLIGNVGAQSNQTISPDTKALIDNLSRVMLLSQLFLLIGTFFGGLANAHQRFIISSLAGVVYNVGTIFGIVFLSGPLGILAPAIGVLLGSFLHIVVQLPVVSSIGFKYIFSFDFWDSGVKDVFKMMSIRNISLVVEQASDLISINLALYISLASSTLLTVAQHLYAAPVALLGSTIAQAAFPVLSKEQASGDKESFKATLLTTMHQILFLSLPAAAILIVLRIPVVRIAFGTSHFSWPNTWLTGQTIAYMALGLAAQTVILLFVRGFYALKDTKTPVIVSIITVILDVSLSVLFIRIMHFDVWSLGLAYAVTTNLSFLLLLYFLDRKIEGFDRKALIIPAAKMLLAAVTSALALYIPIKALDKLVIDTTRVGNLLLLTAIATTFGLSIYVLLVWLMDVKELETFTNLFKKIAQLEKKVRTEEIEEIVE